jgi:hypothetical protein
VAQDDAQAIDWFRKAAQQGGTEAQYNLGLVFYKGRGVARDYVQAVRWFRMAAEQGRAEAQYNLAVMYDNGRGLQKDVLYAHMWFDVAASLGDAQAAEARDVAAKKMTAEEIAKAQALARQCIAQGYKGC